MACPLQEVFGRLAGMLAGGEVILPAEPSHPAIPRMGLAHPRVGGMAEKGMGGSARKAYGNFSVPRHRLM